MISVPDTAAMSLMMTGKSVFMTVAFISKGKGAKRGGGTMRNIYIRNKEWHYIRNNILKCTINKYGNNLRNGGECSEVLYHVHGVQGKVITERLLDILPVESLKRWRERERKSVCVCRERERVREKKKKKKREALN